MTHDIAGMPRVKISDPMDLVSLVPYLIGFHPDESAVVMVFEDGRLVACLRMDLADCLAADQIRLHLDTSQAARSTTAVMIIGYGADLDQVHLALALLEAQVPPADLVDSVVVSGERWWSRTCPGTQCWPPEGNQLHLATPAAAAAVVAGCTALGSRAELQASVAGPQESEEFELSALFAERQDHWSSKTLTQRKGAIRRLVNKSLGRRVAVQHLVDLAVLADEIAVRDAAWLLLDRATARRHQELWTQVTTVAIDAYATPVLCLLGMAAWLNGSGALLNCCITRALALEPDYSMLSLLEQVQLGAVHPSLWDQMTDQATEGVDCGAC